MLLGSGVERGARLGDRIAIPMAAYFAHTMVMRQGAAAGQDLLACTVLNGLEYLNRIGYVQIAKTKVKVYARPRIVGLCHPRRDGVVRNVVPGAFLQTN